MCGCVDVDEIFYGRSSGTHQGLFGEKFYDLLLVPTRAPRFFHFSFLVFPDSGACLGVLWNLLFWFIADESIYFMNLFDVYFIIIAFTLIVR